MKMKKKELVYLVCLGIKQQKKKSANEGIGSIEIKKSSPKLQRVVALLM